MALRSGKRHWEKAPSCDDAAHLVSNTTREAQGLLEFYACPNCEGVAFGTKRTLKTHIETVHEKRRDHARGYCKGVAFGTAGNLKAHISAIHLKIKRSRGAK